MYIYLRIYKRLAIIHTAFNRMKVGQSKGGNMATTRVFKSGNSQAVRLPKEFSVSSKVLEIFRRGDEIVLREPTQGLTRAFEVLTELPDDFFAEGRRDAPPQHREGL
jgi:antitoxin VapB